MAEILLPVMLKVAGKKCVVIGGGEVAAQKVNQLLECNAFVVVVSPELCSVLAELEKQGRLQWLPMRYEPSVLEDSFLVFACTDEKEVNCQIFADCQARKIWCNVVDEPEICNFYMPSILRRGDLAIAVSTSGNSPAFARKVRLFLESVIGEEFGMLVSLLGEMKGEMRETLKTIEQRRKFIERVWESDVWRYLSEGDLEGARICLRNCIAEVAMCSESNSALNLRLSGLAK
ncbi:MAG: bifunctional precorrin-2 dehydrogenase/sirohydrochlorin ferrochelatase [Armatimonadetes bacterium]|nr:bifunctional precorrin-2 dehydrogenase/sirohydrochlorin ferrochelatase [Armatimonadota bacterium]